MQDTITLEQLEQLADDMAVKEDGKRDKLFRLIRAYARILSINEPKRFTAQPLEYADVGGRADTSGPPSQKWRDYSGPRLKLVREPEWKTKPTSSGFYHDWDAVTTDGGLYVDAAGDIYQAALSGSGSYKQYAASSGYGSVMIKAEYSKPERIDTAALEEAEKYLRELAFPLIVEKAIEGRTK